MSRTENIPNAVAAVVTGKNTAGPSSAEALADAERRLRVRLPQDVRAFYLQMNGTSDMTDVNHGLVYLWPIENWKRVEDESPQFVHPPLENAIVFADHSAWCFAYGANFPAAAPEEMRIHLVGDCLPTCIASTFTEFIKMILSNHPSLYGATG